MHVVLESLHAEHPSAHFSHFPSNETYPSLHDPEHVLLLSSNVEPVLHDVHLVLVSTQSKHVSSHSSQTPETSMYPTGHSCLHFLSYKTKPSLHFVHFEMSSLQSSQFKTEHDRHVLSTAFVPDGQEVTHLWSWRMSPSSQTVHSVELEHSEQFIGHLKQVIFVSATNFAFEAGSKSSTEFVADSSFESGVSVCERDGVTVAEAIGDFVGEYEGDGVGMLHWYTHTFPLILYPLKQSVHFVVSPSHLAQPELAQALHTPPTAPVPGGH